MTVQAALCAWLSSLEVAESTRRSYRATAMALEAFCGNTDLSRLSLETLERFRGTRKRTLAPRSLNRELAVLRIFFRYCHDHGWIAQNPAQKLRPLKVRVADKEPLTPAEVERLLAACQTDRERALILLLRHSALRVSDVATLARQRIKNGRLCLRTRKTGGEVSLPIPDALERLLDSISSVNGHFFWTGESTPRTATALAERTLARIFHRAGFKRAEPHRFRHTLATEMAAHGASMTLIAEVLGITPQVADRHYRKWSQAYQDKIDKVLGRVFAVTTYQNVSS